MTDEDAAEMAAFDALLAEVARCRESLTVALESGSRVFRHNRRDDWLALVTQSARPDCPAGSWQVTRLDADGPVGHRYGTQWAGVVDALYEDGYTVPA